MLVVDSIAGVSQLRLRRWKDVVKEVLGYWDINTKEGKRYAFDRKKFSGVI